MRFLRKAKNGDIEFDQLGMLILGLILFIILIYIVTVVIGGEMGNQTTEVKDVLTNIG